MPKSDSSTVPKFVYSTDGTPPEERFSAWSAVVETFFDVEPSGDTDLDGSEFRSELTAYALGPVLFGRAAASSAVVNRTVQTIARSRVDHLMVQLYTEGEIVGTAAGLPFRASGGDVLVFDLGETVEARAGPFVGISLIVPRGIVETASARPERFHGLVVGAGSAAGRLIAGHFRDLLELAPSMRTDECHQLVGGTVALVFACLEQVLAQRDGDGTVLAEAEPLARIRRYVDDNLGDPRLSVDTIAATFGFSRATLYRLFEPLGGVAEYIRRKRLARAFFDVTSPALRARRINDIARRWNFNSESAFTRAFKAAYGITPSAARDAALDGAGPHVTNDGSEPSITRWMREIGRVSHRPNGDR